MEKIKAWWFEPADGKLGNGDGRIPVAGETHTVDCVPKLCEIGMHATKRLIEALYLGFAYSTRLWRVEISGGIKSDYYSLIGKSRKYLWRVDISDVLQKFARKSALDVIHLWEAPDIVIKYLKSGDKSLRRKALAISKARAIYWAAETSNHSNMARYWASSASEASADTVYIYYAAAYAAAALYWAKGEDMDNTRQKQNKRLTAMVYYAHKKEEKRTCRT
jgi:hypothetical protein